MVYNFPLPTTSHLAFHNYIYSNTHPSLPQAASTARHSLRIALKAHKRLTPRERENNLQNVLNSLNEYIPYLFAISDGLSRKTSSKGGDEGGAVDITQKEEIAVEWRPILPSNLARLKAGGSSGARALRGQGIDFEIAFVIGTLAYVLSGLARVGVLRTLYASSTPSAEQRAAAVQNATKQLLQASAAHSLIARSRTSTEVTQNIPQLNTAVQSALASLALGEATLLAVLKDDAYTFSCIQSRNPDDKEWMVRAPEIPKVRAVVFARLCLRGAEYAEQAAAGLGAAVSEKSRGEKGTFPVKVDEDLIKYAQTTAKVARAKACRFFGVDAELSGKTGEGIAWMRAGKDALGLRRAEGESTKGGTLSKLKKGWTDRRDGRKLERSNAESTIVQGGELGRGDDAGWEEEGRVIEELESKWVKMNDTVITQIVPPSGPLLANMPSGRDIHRPPGPYTPPSLDSAQLARMRVPPDEAEQELAGLAAEDDSDEEISPSGERVPPGTFPGTKSATAESDYF
ncbi:pH-response regulator protein palC [Talaromyces islandicus]|uniref:pH-response regulator protein palC n=1 Tax=Talaromyces islandicus TaxID=28573 RepID=A0A0U1M9M3_TALIS|nr:pH-response regulator protein palC [Talaromyces islandicus]